MWISKEPYEYLSNIDAWHSQSLIFYLNKGNVDENVDGSIKNFGLAPVVFSYNVRI